MVKLFVLSLICINYAYSNPDVKSGEQVYGASAKENFTYYKPTYFIFGENDLKIQFSGKYRLAKSQNIYMAYTQLMFWGIYDESKPFIDIMYNPEVFYRLLEKENSIITSLDFGYAHISNGKDKQISRSLDKIFAKANAATEVQGRALLAELEIYHLGNKDGNNHDIQDHLGYWDLHLIFKNIFLKDFHQIDLEFKVFSGKEVYDFDKGGRLFGLIYQSKSENFSPSVYLQYYSGYLESLLGYRDRVDELRLGLMLFI